MNLSPLTDRMDLLSRQTWFNLTEARRLNMRMGEVTISEVNLLAIRQLIETAALDIEIVPTRADESKTGVDFEIWIDHKGTHFLGYAIQAKVVGVRDDKYTYGHLSHKAGKPEVFQYDLLDVHAKSVNAQAVHVYFNGWASTSLGAPTLPSGPDAELFGCAAVMTSVVREIRSKRKGSGASVTASDYLARAFPWSELFCAPLALSRPARIAGGDESADDKGGGDDQGGDNGPDGPDGGAGRTDVEPRPPGPDGGDGGGGGTDAAPTEPGPAPTYPIDLSPQGIRSLEQRMRELGGEFFEPRHAIKLPDYVTQSRGQSRSQLGTEDDLPTFALVIRVD